MVGLPFGFFKLKYFKCKQIILKKGACFCKFFLFCLKWLSGEMVIVCNGDTSLYSVIRKSQCTCNPNQARSQDLEKGGAILKEWEVCKRRWLEFSLTRKFKGFFRPKLGDLQKKKKKKKGLRQNSVWFFGRNPTFKRFFRPKLGDLQKKKKKKKKKKRFSPKFRAIFHPISQVQTFEGGSFRMGGLFSIFHRKSASKAQKTCFFAYFTSQWGGSSPPAPPWLRYWSQCINNILSFRNRWSQV